MEFIKKKKKKCKTDNKKCEKYENYQKMFGKNLKKQFANTYEFYNHDNNKFTLLLRKCDYPCKCIDD